MIKELVLLLLGTGILAVSADKFVEGATAVAKLYGISSLVIGLTVVAFGTSAPELCVSLIAAFSGTSDLAVGNVLGSNVFNILVIVGVSALITRVPVSRDVKKREMPIMLVVMCLFLLFGIDGTIARVEGVILSLGIFGYLYYNYQSAKNSRKNGSQDSTQNSDVSGDRATGLTRHIIYLVLGLTGLVLGSEIIVSSATVLARLLGVSELLIGITLVAIGTSLPELATTVAAAVRKHPELALGNAIGSNVFNVLCVIGFTSTVLPLSVNQKLISFDLWYMLIVCVIAYLLMSFTNRLGRSHGVLLLALYLGYVAYIILESANA